MKLFLANFWRLKLVLIIPCFGLIACTTFDKSKLDNLSQNEVLRIGHGGSGFSSWIPFNPIPINSYKSFYKALVNNHADGVEIDLQMTADGKFVLYHDNKLDSKTNIKGCIGDINYDELLSIEYKLGFPFDLFQSERIIGLDTLISLMKTQSQFPFLHIDIRNYSACLTLIENQERELELIKILIKRLNTLEVPEDKVMLISLSKPVILEAKRLNCPYLISLEEVGDFDSGLAWVMQHNLKYLTIKPKLLSTEKSKNAHQKGVQIITFGAKSKRGNKRLLNLNPDVIQSNNLPALIDLLLD